MPTHHLYRLCFLTIVCAAIILASCGSEDGPQAPEIGDAQIECGPAPPTSSMNDDAVDSVSVYVTDADRDLVSVTATLNGVPINVSDDNANMWFDWSPSEDDEPLRCSGEFILNVIALDSEGNESQEIFTIEK